MSHQPKGTFAFVSLGCPKNLVDSERMLGKLAQDGFAPTADADGADVVVINTCGFIEAARQESLAVIREMLDLKRQGRVGAVVVAGCLAERKKDELFQEVPEVDQIVGVFGREEISGVVERARTPLPLTPLPPSPTRGEGGRRGEGEQRSLFRPAPVRALEDTARLRVTPRHYAYLKISEGCDRLCTFCAIPAMRGKHVTKPIEEVVREARELVADGVRELILVAQDTTYYGLDLYGRVRLAELLRELDRVEGVDWLRILYAYPIHFTDELIETLASAAKVIPYLDIPLQHINDRLLRRMQRRVNRAPTETRLGRLRAAVPNLTLRTTFIVGFPGETDAEFEELVEFVQGTRFERAG
ncbi:MAG: 30S ribosomal protein S12 methylthiotransferase RimO, partial [Gemmataceae bacterium]|nr:30S ribosomal protein S12 methylthiotransferase RimO [Gemmataceae bacterium]